MHHSKTHIFYMVHHWYTNKQCITPTSISSCTPRCHLVKHFLSNKKNHHITESGIYTKNGGMWGWVGWGGANKEPTQSCLCFALMVRAFYTAMASHIHKKVFQKWLGSLTVWFPVSYSCYPHWKTACHQTDFHYHSWQGAAAFIAVPSTLMEPLLVNRGVFLYIINLHALPGQT